MKTMTFRGGGRIEADEVRCGSEVDLGAGVVVAARQVILGDGVRIGTEDEPDAFRFPGGTRVSCERLALGALVRIGRHVRIQGGDITLGSGCRVGNGTTISVLRRLAIGSHGVINEQCEVAGLDVEIGRELWMLPTAKIGGGSAFEVHSRLRAGHWLHLGMRTFINTARPVTIGHEVGLGTGTCLYTHGAYPSVLDGKPAAFGPISIGDRTWIPGGIINPSVEIGADCIVGVGSVVNRSIPDGALAAGTPAKVIRERAYPKKLSEAERSAFVAQFVREFGEICADREQVAFGEKTSAPSVCVGGVSIEYADNTAQCRESWDGASGGRRILLTYGPVSGSSAGGNAELLIDLDGKRLSGPASPLSQRLLNQLRRYGVRFAYDVIDGKYQPWPTENGC